jgi:transcription antitermination factor NusG
VAELSSYAEHVTEMLVLNPESGRKTKGGEALLEVVTPSDGARWHALWTRSNCEQLVHDQLSARGFELFLPTLEAWTRRGGVRRLSRVPMFAGYLFLCHAMDKSSYIEVAKARGLVNILGERWDQLAVVPDAEIEAIRKLAASGVTILPYPYLASGQRVRIKRGPLAGVEGIVVRTNPKKGLLVVSVELLRRSIAVQLDCTMVEAA